MTQTQQIDTHAHDALFARYVRKDGRALSLRIGRTAARWLLLFLALALLGCMFGDAAWLAFWAIG